MTVFERIDRRFRRVGCIRRGFQLLPLLLRPSLQFRLRHAVVLVTIFAVGKRDIDVMPHFRINVFLKRLVHHLKRVLLAPVRRHG